MSYELREDLIEQIWRDLGRQIERPRIAAVAKAIAADLDGATVTAYVPLFVRRLACERLAAEAAQQAAAQRAEGRP